jgi:predicted alpha/beta superfamily hydrolase
MKTAIKLKSIHLIVLSVLIHFCAMSQEESAYLQQLGLKDSLYSKTLGETRTIYVQLPSGYNPESQQEYPVVYLLDGEMLLPALSSVYENYYGGFMPEMILVGISNDHDRTKNLTPTTITTKYGMPFQEESGEAATFARFMKEELIPFVENKYRATYYRTLIGHSYGGLFVCYQLLNDPKLFANYLAIDPSLDWDNQQLLNQAQKSLQIDLGGKALFMSMSGQLHMQDATITIDNLMDDTSDYTLFSRSNVLFSNLLKEKGKGLKSYWKHYPNDLHGTVPLPSMLDGMLALFQWYQMEQTDKFNSPETPKDELYGIIKYRAQKLKTHFGYSVPPYPEDLMNMSGYMNMDMGQPAKAKMFFELATEYYPTSANAFDSLADYYESQDDNANALKAVTKAYALSGSDYHKERMEAFGSSSDNQ